MAATSISHHNWPPLVVPRAPRIETREEMVARVGREARAEWQRTNGRMTRRQAKSAYSRPNGGRQLSHDYTNCNAPLTARLRGYLEAHGATSLEALAAAVAERPYRVRSCMNNASRVSGKEFLKDDDGRYRLAAADAEAARQ